MIKRVVSIMLIVIILFSPTFVGLFSENVVYGYDRTPEEIGQDIENWLNYFSNNVSLTNYFAKDDDFIVEDHSFIKLPSSNIMGKGIVVEENGRVNYHFSVNEKLDTTFSITIDGQQIYAGNQSYKLKEEGTDLFMISTKSRDYVDKNPLDELQGKDVVITVKVDMRRWNFCRKRA